MERRLKLHKEFLEVVNNVYFQPPESVKLKYPCIIYIRSQGNTLYADDVNYRHMKSYTVTVIDKDPDSNLPDKLLSRFSYCRIDRIYTYENLYHTVMNLFY